MASKQSNPKTVQVFVYGSLKKGFPLEGWMKRGKFIGKDKILGYTLIGFGPYPGLFAVRGKARTSFEVAGEVYELPYNDFNELAVMEERVGYTTLPDTTVGGRRAFLWMYDEIHSGVVEWIDTTKPGKKAKVEGMVLLSEEPEDLNDAIPF